MADTADALGKDFSYPHDAHGKPIDTPDWRDGCNIQKEASAKDTALITAVRKFEKEPERLAAALAAPDCDVNAVDKYGMSALHLALKAKLSKVRPHTPEPLARGPQRSACVHVGGQVAMQILDTGKCDINLQSRRGFTPLMVAAWKGELDCCEKIINLGAKLYVKDTGGRNAWGVAHYWHIIVLAVRTRRWAFAVYTCCLYLFGCAAKTAPSN